MKRQTFEDLHFVCCAQCKSLKYASILHAPFFLFLQYQQIKDIIKSAQFKEYNTVAIYQDETILQSEMYCSRVRRLLFGQRS